MATIIGTITNNTINGSSGDDTIEARAGNDTLNGNAGNDALSGEEGDDKLSGGVGNDSLSGGNGVDILNGGTGDDTLSGDDGVDTLDGGAGNDTLWSDHGDDTYLFGKGDGQDILKVWDLTTGETNTLLFKSGVTASEVAGARQGNDLILSIISTTDKITVESFFENDDPYNNGINPLQQVKFSDGTTWTIADILISAFKGSDENDVLNGTIYADSVNGGAGNDNLTGNTGDDTLNGEIGNDNLSGGNGVDILNGGTGDDTLSGDDGVDTLDGGAGNDTLWSDHGDDTYLFGKGDDQDILKVWDLTTGETNTLLFKSGVSASEVAGARLDNKLILSIIGTTDSITIDYFFYNDDPYNNSNVLQQVKFSDGTTWDIDTIVNVSFTGIPNNAPTGVVTISDTTPEKNQLLTATHTLADSDGLGTISYQWQAGSTVVGTGATHKVTSAEVDQTLTVTASYTDLLGNAESVTSQATAAVSSISAASIFNAQGNASKDVGIIRVLADFSTAAYHLERIENKVINDDGGANADGAVTALTKQGWTPVMLAPALVHTSVVAGQTVTNRMFSDGFFVNGNAAAVVERCGDAIVLSFRGTNDNGDSNNDSGNAIHPDVSDWNDMPRHYALLQPLINVFDAYVAANHISQVYVTGHSLGGAMAIQYMADHADGSFGANYDSVTFAAPPFLPAPSTSGADSQRITHIEITGDPVPDAPGVHPGRNIHFEGNQTPATISATWNATYHSVDYYRQITKSVDADSWVKILAETGDQTVLLGGEVVGNDFVVDGQLSGNNSHFSSGNDTLTDAALWDYKVFYGGKGNDTITGGGANELMLGGIGEDTLNGNGGADRLFGGNDIDYLFGGKGADRLLSGLGNDKLTGGAGADKFVFDTRLNTDTNVDFINDFNVIDDTLWFDRSVFSKFSSAGSLAASMLSSGTVAVDKNDFFIYNKGNGELFYDADGSGIKTAIEIAILGAKTHPDLSASDFLIV